MKQSFIIFALAAVFFLSTGPAFSDDKEMIYGSQLMTQQERMDHREKLRNAKTNEERVQYRKEHHEKMDKRAKAQGMTLPHESHSEGSMDHNDGMGFDGGMGFGGDGNGDGNGGGNGGGGGGGGGGH